MRFNLGRIAMTLTLSLCLGCGSKPATWENPPQGLEFLRTVPELRGITLEISEQDFLKLVAPQKQVKVEPDRSDTGEVSYHVTTPSGENVVVMFGEGTCKGIQRLQPSPVPKS